MNEVVDNATIEQLLTPVRAFLHCATPQAWTEEASKPANLPTLLLDHLLCELKAAQSAMLLLRRYAIDNHSAEHLLNWLKPYEDFAYRQQGDWRQLFAHTQLRKRLIARAEKPYSDEIIDKMVLLIKEELHHFLQVLEVMDALGIAYQNISSSRYARQLLSHSRTHEPATLVDKLICGAYIEARSCERFACLIPVVPPALGRFYFSLLRSEARHFADYLTLAQKIAGGDINDRLTALGEKEAALITSADEDFKFHSGMPVTSTH